MADSQTKILAGDPEKLGATYDGKGVNFALFSANATKVELCLFDENDVETRIELTNRTQDGVWSGYLPDAKPGLRYGYRVDGPYDPAKGLLFNPNKVLFDPYARELDRDVVYDKAFMALNPDGTRNDADTAKIAPKGIVQDPDALKKIGSTAKPEIAWDDTVIYEAHTKGFTIKHPTVPEADRGKFGGMAQDDVIKYLKEQGISSVELLPVQEFSTHGFLADKGLQNYWGYEPVAYFAPHKAYGSPAEFKKMVNKYHEAGMEVILDVVYNHTGEGGKDGEMLSLKGIDSSSYYASNPNNRGEFREETGCGNALDLNNKMALKLTVDSLRYWAQEMGVDGFRFDLAPVLARDNNRNYDKNHPFFQALRDDPVLSKTKLIAEPWDCGWGGYQVGNFPKDWMEWNDKFRDNTRRFWCGAEGLAAEMARRMTASDDLRREGSNESPSVNFVTAHDGFTAKDLWSYNEKHNEANGEGNRDGNSNNASNNWGHEGYKDEGLDDFRNKMVRNVMATLLMADGVPMRVAGDEFNRSQGGNNNAYCQDSEIGWVNWDKLKQSDVQSAEMVGFMTRLRREHPALANISYFNGQSVDGGAKDITWIRPDGQEMTPQDWQAPYAKTLSFVLNGKAAEQRGKKADDDFMIVMNAHNGDIEWKLPPAPNGQKWEVAFDTAKLGLEKQPADQRQAGDSRKVEAHSVVVFQAVREENRTKEKSRIQPSVLSQIAGKRGR